jgi:hypothetical protein
LGAATASAAVEDATLAALERGGHDVQLLGGDVPARRQSHRRPHRPTATTPCGWWHTILLRIAGSFIDGFGAYALFGWDDDQEPLQPSGLTFSILVRSSHCSSGARSSAPPAPRCMTALTIFFLFALVGDPSLPTQIDEHWCGTR